MFGTLFALAPKKDGLPSSLIVCETTPAGTLQKKIPLLFLLQYHLLYPLPQNMLKQGNIIDDAFKSKTWFFWNFPSKIFVLYG